MHLFDQAPAHDNSTAFISISITLLGALIAVVWRAGALVATMTSALTELRAMVAELKNGLEHVRDFPVVKQRVEALEDIVRSSLTSKVETLWTKVFSLDKHRAVSELRERSHSRPEILPEEEDPK